MSELTISYARSVDLQTMAGKYVKLRHASSTEMEGPCPKCGGEDRFHVKVGAFFCRTCHPKFGDAIEFVRWMEGKTFSEAIETLTGQALPHTERQQPAPHRTTPEAPQWDAAAVAIRLTAMQAALPDSPGADYLNSRGLWPDTWAAFNIGYNAERNAVAMPWYRGGTLNAIRYRLIDPPAKQRIISEPGSRFGHLLFGGQALPPVSPEARSQRYLLIVEGEINALSAWQAMHAARLDVLSLGSESTRIPDSFLPTAAQYRSRIVWMDKESRAREEAARIDAGAMWSEANGAKRDANDYLRDGNLLDVLGYALQKQGKPEHAEALRWDLCDAAKG